MSGLLQCLSSMSPMPDGGQDTDAEGNPKVRLDAVAAAELAMVVQFVEHHKGKPLPPLESPLPSNDLADVILDEFDIKLVDLDTETLFKLLDAAHFLRVDGLVDLVCAKVATMIRGKTKAEMQQNFPLDSPLTIEEEAEFREEHEWLDAL